MMVPEVQKLPIFAADALHVVDGVAIGDALASIDDLILDDVYQLCAKQEIGNLAGASSDPSLRLEACLTFMTPNSVTLQVLLLTAADAVFFSPLSPMDHSVPYRLICCDKQSAVSLRTADDIQPICMRPMTNCRTA